MRIPIQASWQTYSIKKSQFHAYALPVATREEAMSGLVYAKTLYPDARHHCWAYLIGDPQQPDTQASNDDGEPSGTAGKPMLNVLQHNDIGNVMVIICRYFGGIKLGAGGLVRAYSTATLQVINGLTTTQYIPTERVVVNVDFKDEQYIRHWVEMHKGRVEQCTYASDVRLTLHIPSSDIASLLAMQHTSAHRLHVTQHSPSHNKP